MIARIYDANLSGYMETEIDSIESLADEFDTYRGIWHDYTGEGVAILDDPTAHVFLSTPDEHDPYPDWIIEFDDARGVGYTWYEA